MYGKSSKSRFAAKKKFAANANKISIREFTKQLLCPHFASCNHRGLSKPFARVSKRYAGADVFAGNLHCLSIGQRQHSGRRALHK